MTPSEQTSNTTLNILHGVRRSDPHPPPPLPLFCGVLPLSSVPSSLSATSRFAPTCCYVVGALLRAYVGFCPLVAPPHFLLTISQFVWCGFDLGRAFLPSFALGLVFLLPFVRGLSRFVVLSFWCFCLRICWCLSVAVVLPFVCGGLLFVCFVCCFVGTLPGRLLLPFPLRLVPCGALVQFLRWSLPLGIWLL